MHRFKRKSALCAITAAAAVGLSWPSFCAQALHFSDVAPSAWYYEDVNYVVTQQLMNGTGGNTFSPDLTTTRAMITTVLWRLENQPFSESKLSFEDVKPDSYYAQAVAWAYKNELINGYSDKVFAPNDSVTREQLATMLFRYASFKKQDVSQRNSLESYTDKDEISNYAVEALKWANAAGLITGMSSEALAPKDTAKRCQVAAILKRFHSTFLSTDENNSAPAQTKSEEHAKSDTDNADAEPNNEKNTENSDTSGKPKPSTVKETTGTGASASQESENDQKPTVFAETLSGQSGDIVEMHIQIKHNPGVLGMMFSIIFDDTVFKLESAENGAAVDGVLELTTSKTLESGAKFVWDGLEIAPEQIKDGDILNLRFQILPGAQAKEYPIQIYCESGDVVNNDLESIEIAIENGGITVK